VDRGQTDSRQQTADSRQQTANSKQQTADNRKRAHMSQMGNRRWTNDIGTKASIEEQTDKCKPAVSEKRGSMVLGGLRQAHPSQHSEE
jgi:hypothetical protein